MANKKGTALLMVWADIPADKEAEFNKWYNEEHLAELLSIPGVLNAARYEAVKSGPKHLACYELESAAVVQTPDFKDRPRTPWGEKVSPSIIGNPVISNVYEMIRPDALSTDALNSGMAPSLQIGRMAVPADQEEQWNHWYNTVYTANYEKVPGCIRARRFKAVRGEPKYSVVYEFENEKVSETDEWMKQRDINPDNDKMRNMMTHATGSPGVWVKTFEL